MLRMLSFSTKMFLIRRFYARAELDQSSCTVGVDMKCFRQ